MHRALDREPILELLCDGRAEPLVRYGMDARNEGDVPELEERFDAEYGYDPDRARELLAEAGYPDAFPDPVIPIISSVVPGSPDAAPMAEVLQVFFEEIGLQTEIREMDFASLGALGRGRRSYTIHHMRNAPIRPTEVYFVNAHTSAGSPYRGYEDDTIQGLIDELRRTLDPDERHRIAQEAFTYLYEQYSDMPIAGIPAQIIVNPATIAAWEFPGVTTIGTSHWHLIQPTN